MTDYIIQIKNLSKNYTLKNGDTVNAVNDVTLDIARDEFCTILGNSGSGKTTFLNLLGGLDKPTKGEIIINGKDVAKLNENELVKFRREEVGFVFQSFNLIQSLTAIENVEVALAPLKMNNSERLEKSKKLLETVGLKQRINHLPVELSAGEQQRVAIARAFANEPKILLLDEPTGNLDTKTGKEIMELCHKASKENGQTVIAVTHASYIEEYANRMLLMQDGKIKKYN